MKLLLALPFLLIGNVHAQTANPIDNLRNGLKGGMTGIPAECSAQWQKHAQGAEKTLNTRDWTRQTSAAKLDKDIKEQLATYAASRKPFTRTRIAQFEASLKKLQTEQKCDIANREALFPPQARREGTPETAAEASLKRLAFQQQRTLEQISKSITESATTLAQILQTAK